MSANTGGFSLQPGSSFPFGVLLNGWIKQATGAEKPRDILGFKNRTQTGRCLEEPNNTLWDHQSVGLR